MTSTWSSWFAGQDLGEASDAQRQVVRRIGALLDELEPARLHPDQQTVEQSRGVTWVTLRHDSEPEVEIRLVIVDGWVNFYGVMGHDEAYNGGPDPADAWELETVEILSDLLRAEFTITTYELGGKPWREVLTIGEPYGAMEWTTPLAWTALLPHRRWARPVETRRTTFGCHPA